MKKTIYEVYTFRKGMFVGGTITHLFTDTLADAQHFMAGNPDYHVDMLVYMNGILVNEKNII